MAEFQYYPGQIDYLARVGTKDAALVAADVGTGKSLFLISLARLKLEDAEGNFRGRALVVVPGGTLRSENSEGDGDPEDADTDSEGSPEKQMSQWRQELARFAPNINIFQIRTWADYAGLMRADGSTPSGIYITYYEALFRNGAIHSVPDSWGKDAHKKLCTAIGSPIGDLEYAVYATVDEAVQGVGRWFEPRELRGKLTNFPPRKDELFRFDQKWWRIGDVAARPLNDYAENLGEERNGIRCVASPCLSDSILMWAGAKKQTAWDFVALDEAHYCCNLGAQITKSFIRLQAKYRFAFTATPIPNIVTNLFPLMGWLCVPDWYMGGRRNAAWPYARSEMAAFEKAFISTERDRTAEEMSRNRRSRAIYLSPVISSPARLLKILKPTLAFISKPMCRPEYEPASLIDVRVPLGTSQSKLYAYFMCRSRVPGRHPLHRARRQVAYLRKICADPAGFEKGGPPVGSNFNPKTIAALNLIRDILNRGEQVVVISARIGQTNTIAARLTEAGIPFARIDSTVPPDKHSAEANKVKQGKVPVQLMGIKCASSHSFHQCPNEIVLSLEYSYGSLHQARGRVDRVNSARKANIYCILHKDSIEEAMFDRVATKEDAARICLHGKRLPRDYKPMDSGEVLAEHLAHWETDESRARRAVAALQGAAVPTHIETRTEEDCEAEWPTLRDALNAAWKAMRPESKVIPKVPATQPVPQPAITVTTAVTAPVTTPRRPAWIDKLRARRMAAPVAALLPA
ncbi:MAG: DEAD/DEAH box helicase [Verrucomicrobiales bacterium]|nr:DEAD/DEAH box helicase [Verrucomicrobiales bacterium]